MMRESAWPGRVRGKYVPHKGFPRGRVFSTGNAHPRAGAVQSCKKGGHCCRFEEYASQCGPVGCPPVRLIICRRRGKNTEDWFKTPRGTLILSPATLVHLARLSGEGQLRPIVAADRRLITSSSSGKGYRRSQFFFPYGRALSPGG